MPQKPMAFLNALKKKLSTFVKLGWNSTVIQYLKPLSLRDPSSSFSYRSSVSWEIPDSAPLQPISHATNKLTSPLTPLSARTSVLSLTKSSISLGELRLLGCFSPSKVKTLKSISRQTSGWQVQIALYTRGKAEGLINTRASRMPAFF